VLEKIKTAIKPPRK